jgi:ADP-ribose pyrophosphatase YjhB (NUDIX family)
VDAAVFDDLGRILLIQRSDNHQWALPGGAISTGETLSEAAAREAKEESGVICQAIELLGIYDSRRGGSLTGHHLYHFVFLCKLINADGMSTQPSHAVEIDNRSWFSEDGLPEEFSPGHEKRILDAFRAIRGHHTVYFE